jgi:hypothetical protein
VQDGTSAGLVLQKDRFGNLQLESRRRQAGVGERAERQLDKILAFELHRRQVDRNAYRISPVSSASGMNSAGDMRPRAGLFHRINASKPDTEPALRLKMG